MENYKIHWTASGTMTVESEDGRDAALELAEDMLYNLRLAENMLYTDISVAHADDLDVENVETK
jgi:hypothetical protein